VDEIIHVLENVITLINRLKVDGRDNCAIVTITHDDLTAVVQKLKNQEEVKTNA
jgi:hypothetical protein